MTPRLKRPVAPRYASGVMCWAVAVGAAPEPAEVVQRLTSDDASTRQAALAEAADVGAPMIAPLFRLLAEGDPGRAASIENTLFGIAGRATAPGATEARGRVSAALHAELADGPRRCRAYAARLLALVAGEQGSVRELALALDARDIHTVALSALQRIPGDGASVALITALTAASSTQRPGIARALGARAQRVAVDPLIRWARDGDTDTRVASLQALGQIGGERARPVLERSVDSRDIQVASAACAGLLRVAEVTARERPETALRLLGLVEEKGATNAQREAARTAHKRLVATLPPALQPKQ